MNKIASALLASAVFVLLLLVCYAVHARFLPVNVVLYSALLDAVVAALAAAGVLFAWTRLRNALSLFERGQLVVIWLLAGYAFAISVPTVIDRSLSFYLLEKLQQRGGAIPLASMESVFTREYVKEHHLLQVRLTEQVESGSIRIDNGCVRLTERGQRLADFSRWFRANLLPRHRLLMGEYTADLTDLYRQAPPPLPPCP